MNQSSIARLRLRNQGITLPGHSQPEEIVAMLGAMQAQEYTMAKWAIGLRLPGSTDAEVELAFNEGRILRTHMMRPTWHFVAPQDIRWMQALTAPRVHAFNGFMYRQESLDEKLLRRCHKVLIKALQGGQFLTRAALQEALVRAKIDATGLRLTYIVMHAELEGIICSGPRQGKQFTYALLDERVPPAKTPSKEEALATLALRYFGTRCPATIQDFTWWSGLTVKEAKEGIAALPARFITERIDGADYILDADQPVPRMSGVLSTFLMPDYDEYGISYKNRAALSNGKNNARELLGERADYVRWLVVDGVIDGSWSLTGTKKDKVETLLFSRLKPAQQKAVDKAVARFQAFREVV